MPDKARNRGNSSRRRSRRRAPDAGQRSRRRDRGPGPSVPQRLLGLLLVLAMVGGAAVLGYLFLAAPESDPGPLPVAAAPDETPTPDRTATALETALARVASKPTPAPMPEPSRQSVAPSSTALPALVMAETPAPEPTATVRPTPTLAYGPNIRPTPTPASAGPTVMPEPTATSRPTSTPRPTVAPRPTATPAPSREQQLTQAKNLMLELINEERVRAGASPLVMGDNRAAQVHAVNSLEGCFAGHWGQDGTKPQMRYALAGGYQSNAENTSGLNICLDSGDGYAPLGNIDHAVGRAVDVFMGSSGHRRNVLDPAHRKVNLGIAWDRYNIYVVQHFEGDYVHFEQLPSLENGVLGFKGTLHNGASLVPGDTRRSLGIQVYYDPPLTTLTRGQLARSSAYNYGTPVATVLPPLKTGWSRAADTFSTEVCTQGDPHQVAADAPAPQTYGEAISLRYAPWAGACTTVTLPWVDASRWELGTHSFDVRVSLDSVLKKHGPGVYTVFLWADMGGKPDVVSIYSLFHEVEPPEGYGG